MKLTQRRKDAKILNLLRILGVVMVLIGGAGVGVAQEIVIVNTPEDRNAGCPEVCALREAAAIVADGGTITFEEGLGVITLTRYNPIRIDHNLTIIGREGIILDGGVIDKLFIIERNAEVMFQDLTLRGGYSASDGGAIENHGRLTLDGVLLYGNLSDASGGAIYTTGTLRVSNSTFIDNFAYSGGAITSARTNSTHILNSIFFHNFADADGGALYGDFGGFVVMNSIFVENSARRGGAVLMDGFLQRGVISNSTIYRNRAAWGGGVCNLDEDSLFMLTSSIIAENEADNSPDVCPLMTSGGHNLIGDSAGGRWIATDQLDQHPGVTFSAAEDMKPTLTLNADSPAVGAGDCSGNAALFIAPVTTDQRGMARKTPCAIGAYETESAAN